LFWIEHESEEIGGIYSKPKEDVEFRRDWTTRIGLGFEIPIVEESAVGIELGISVLGEGEGHRVGGNPWQSRSWSPNFVYWNN